MAISGPFEKKPRSTAFKAILTTVITVLLLGGSFLFAYPTKIGPGILNIVERSRIVLRDGEAVEEKQVSPDIKAERDLIDDYTNHYMLKYAENSLGVRNLNYYEATGCGDNPSRFDTGCIGGDDSRTFVNKKTPDDDLKIDILKYFVNAGFEITTYAPSMLNVYYQIAEEEGITFEEVFDNENYLDEKNQVYETIVKDFEKNGLNSEAANKYDLLILCVKSKSKLQKIYGENISENIEVNKKNGCFPGTFLEIFDNGADFSKVDGSKGNLVAVEVSFRDRGLYYVNSPEKVPQVEGHNYTAGQANNSDHVKFSEDCPTAPSLTWYYWLKWEDNKKRCYPNL